MARIMPGAGAAVVTGAIDSGGPAREFALASLGSRSQRKEQSMNPIERGRIAVALSLLVPATALAQATPKKPAAARPASHLVQASDVASQPPEGPPLPPRPAPSPGEAPPKEAARPRPRLAPGAGERRRLPAPRGARLPLRRQD